MRRRPGPDRIAKILRQKIGRKSGQKIGVGRKSVSIQGGKSVSIHFSGEAGRKSGQKIGVFFFFGVRGADGALVDADSG